MQDFAGRVAVITGAASGFGREFARLAAARGMKLVLADVQADVLAATVAELEGGGAQVRSLHVDVARSDEVAQLAELAYASFGATHLLFNNAGVGAGGFIWESSERDWQWVLGVNLWGVIHGVRHFVPRMLAADDEGHIINTASVAGLLAPPNMGVYNVSKHAVVALTETLYQDLRVANSRLGVSVLCPAYVPTGIAASFRHRPPEFASDAPPTTSQRMAQAAIQKAVDSGKLSAVDVARMTFEAIAAGRFYVLTHPGILPTIELRCADILQQRNPSDPYSTRPQVRPQFDT
jgi:NAD(P)-dependent dehydrogenase (short-subunit alcohol dehydrogenase family)